MTVAAGSVSAADTILVARVVRLEAPGVASAGIGVLAAGVPIYWWMRLR